MIYDLRFTICDLPETWSAGFSPLQRPKNHTASDIHQASFHRTVKRRERPAPERSWASIRRFA